MKDNPNEDMQILREIWHNLYFNFNRIDYVREIYENKEIYINNVIMSWIKYGGTKIYGNKMKSTLIIFYI